MKQTTGRTSRWFFDDKQGEMAALLCEKIEVRLGLVLPPELATEVNRLACRVRFAAGQTLLREGERAPGVYLIERGVVRGYYIDEAGNAVTKCFAAEGEFFATEGLRTGQGASFTIESLEALECILLPYGLIEAVAKREPVLEKRLRELFANEVARLEARGRELLLYDAAGRYERFCQQYPGLFERLPLKLVASYIGVQPATLSRIRKAAQN